MKIFIDIGHPAHVHVFKNFIKEMEKKGHRIFVTARDKEVTKNLLEAYQIPYIHVGSAKPGKLNLMLEWINRDIKIYKIAKKENPDILIGVLSPTMVHAAKILGKKSIVFTDSEPESIKFPILDIITLPFVDSILTLTSVQHNYGKKEVRINSYKELAYLHPKWFTPNPHVLKKAGLSEKDKYIIIRFIGWAAYHDVGRGGFDIEHQRLLIRKLVPHARVFISSENPLPEEFEEYRIPIKPEEMHDFLCFASLLVSDSQTMTTEAAVLGTPAIRCNSFVGKRDMGNFIELENKYGLIFNFDSVEKAIDKAVELITWTDCKKIWACKREKLLQDKTDFSSFLIQYVEINYKPK